MREVKVREPQFHVNDCCHIGARVQLGSGIRQQQFTYEQSWGEILQKYRQWRRYICPDHIGEFANIAVADAWHCPIPDNQPGLIGALCLYRKQRCIC
jgi:hypothetical protein